MNFEVTRSSLGESVSHLADHWPLGQKRGPRATRPLPGYVSSLHGLGCRMVQSIRTHSWVWGSQSWWSAKQAEIVSAAGDF